MVKVVYPDGHEVSFMWVNNGFGYNRQGKKVFRYPLPDKAVSSHNKIEEWAWTEWSPVRICGAHIRYWISLTYGHRRSRYSGSCLLFCCRVKQKIYIKNYQLSKLNIKYQIKGVFLNLIRILQHLTVSSFFRKYTKTN